MSIRPELWGWSTSPLTLQFWGWEDAGVIQNIITGIPRVVRGEPTWKTVHNIQPALTLIRGTFISKIVLYSFAPRMVVPAEIPSKIIKGTFTPKILRPESIASRISKENKTSSMVHQLQRPAIISHAEQGTVRIVGTQTNSPAKVIK